MAQRTDVRSPVPSVRLLHGGRLVCVPAEPDALEGRDRASAKSFIVADNAERAKGERFKVRSGDDKGWGLLLDRGGITENRQCVKAGCNCRETPPILGWRWRHSVSQKSLDVIVPP
jgi:hypothetical protein